jgi:hypothetical protein
MGTISLLFLKCEAPPACPKSKLGLPLAPPCCAHLHPSLSAQEPWMDIYVHSSMPSVDCPDPNMWCKGRLTLHIVQTLPSMQVELWLQLWRWSCGLTQTGVTPPTVSAGDDIACAHMCACAHTHTHFLCFSDYDKSHFSQPSNHLYHKSLQGFVIYINGIGTLETCTAFVFLKIFIKIYSLYKGRFIVTIPIRLML